MKNCLGIEIGHYRVKIAYMEHGELQTYVSERLETENQTDMKVYAELIKDVLKENNIRCKNAVFVLRQDDTYVKRCSVPLMTVDQLKLNLPFEFHDYIGDELEQYQFDYGVIERTEDQLDLIAACCRKDLCQQFLKLAKMAKLKEVPVIIKEYSPQEVMEIALIENIQRRDLNPIEEARAYQRLIKDYRLKQDEVAEKVSKSRAAITNALRLLKLDERVQDMVIEGKISSGHARTILSIDDNDKQYMIAQKIFDEKLSVREVEKLMKSLDAPEKKEKKLPANDFVYRDIEQKLKNILGTQVIIKNKSNNKGKIEIDYYSQAELERIYDMLRKLNNN